MSRKRFNKARLIVSFLLALCLLLGVLPMGQGRAVEVTGKEVTFTYVGDENTQSVTIPGSFNGWDSSENNAFAMTKGADGVWSYTTVLNPGVYEYKFLVNTSDWIMDPSNTLEENGNSKLVVPGLIITSPYELIKGNSMELTADLLDATGNRSPVTASFSLKVPVDGVSLENNLLTLADTLASDTQVDLTANFESHSLEFTVKSLDKMYEYIIKYKRADGNQRDWDLWIWWEGKDGAAYQFTETTADGYAQAKLQFESNTINVIPKLGNWESQDPTETVTVAEGESSATLVIDQGIVKDTDRKVQVTYIRNNKDYDGWGLWLWQSEKSDGDMSFTERNEDGDAVVIFPIGETTTDIGFVLHKTVGEDLWAAKDAYEGDRIIKADPSQQLTKVTIYEGVEKIEIVPSLHGPIIENAQASIFYRDQALYMANAMSDVSSVIVRIQMLDDSGNPTGEVAEFPMEYDAKNEYFKYVYDIPQEGTYRYDFVVSLKDGTKSTVADFYNQSDDETSSFSYRVPEITLTTSLLPAPTLAGQSVVLSVAIDNPENVGIKKIIVDASSIGGSNQVNIDPTALEQTLQVGSEVAPGQYDLPIVVIDEFGNTHESVVKLTVTEPSSGTPTDANWEEAVIYFMLTDRFYNGDSSNDNPNGVAYNKSDLESFHGGDFQGVIDKISYLKELGVNTIWITPIVDNIDFNLREGKEGEQYGYHGYWAKDFTKIDEHLGNLDKFKELLETAHDNNIKVMVDVVLNHTGYGLKPGEASDVKNFPTDEDRARFDGMLRTDPVSGDPVYGELAGLPDFITEDPAVRQQIIDWQASWLERTKTDRGDTIDYFRVDTVKHVDITTWKMFKNRLTKIDPTFKMIGEYFGANIDNTGGYLNSGTMDSLLDFQFKDLAEQFIKGNIDSVESKLEARNAKIDSNYMMGQFLSSHDEDGFLITRAGNDIGKFLVAASLQMTAKGQPVIYYGEEIGLSGKNAGNMDNLEFGENRYDFDWSKTTENPVLDHYKKMIGIRNDYSSVFARGDRVKVAGSDAELYSVFSRSYGDETLLVGLNITPETMEKTFAVPFEPGQALLDIYNNVKYIVDENGQITLTIPSKDVGGTGVLVLDEVVTPEPKPEPEPEPKPEPTPDPTPEVEATPEPEVNEEEVVNVSEQEPEKTPTQTDVKPSPKTGDDGIILYAGGIAIAGLALFLINKSKRDIER